MQVGLLLGDGNKHVGGHGAPDLHLHCVLARAQKALDAQMLFDPLEEQLDLPAIFIQGGNAQRRQACVVGQEYQGLARFGILQTDATQMLGVVLGDVKAIERDSLIENDATDSPAKSR
jgi:hypothetical protein